MSRSRVQRKVSLAAAMLLAAALSAAAQETAPPASHLPLDQIVDNLVRKNQERAHALLHSEATRVYHLAYRGFPGDKEAEMTVEASYSSPATKDFKIVSQSGSKLIVDRVFKKLLESEEEAAEPAVSEHTQLNRRNYDFELVDYEPSNT